MSLNWKEINLILEELALENSHIQKIHQPDYHSLIFEQYKPGEKFTLYIGLKQGNTRIHSLSRKIQGGKKLQRFAQFLRSRILGGRIIRACQLGSQRIVKLTVLRGGETTLLWVRLWGGAGNVIATDNSGTILDAFYRRPKRGETSGNEYNPEAVLDMTIAQKDEAYEVRDLPGTGS